MKSFLFLLLASIALHAQNVYAPNNVAVDGYDVVAYFDRSPKKGNVKYSTKHKGVNYYFSSQKNLSKFKAKPTSYLPEYGGYCAYAVAVAGSKVEVNPLTYKLVNNKLYLFYNKGGSNTKVKWDRNQSKYLVKADRNWRKIIAK